MKKITLPNDKLQRIVSLRETGFSWVKIQRETGVARRIAKRDYDEWHQKQSQKQIIEARKEVAAQEYRAHLDLLCQFANHLLDSLVIPNPVNDLRKSDEVISQFLKKDIYQEQPLVQLRLEGQREKRVLRLNELLFKSLHDHAQRRLSWEVLEVWKSARDSCVSNLTDMRKEIREIYENIVKQDHKLQDAIAKEERKQNVSEHIVDGILTHLWLSDVMGNESKVEALKGESLTRLGTAWVIFHDKAPEQLQLTFNSEDRANNLYLVKEIVRVSQWAITNLRRGEQPLIDSMRENVHKMSEAINGLEAILNPLVLRPLILNTLCDICPIQPE